MNPTEYNALVDELREIVGRLKKLPQRAPKRPVEPSKAGNWVSEACSLWTSSQGHVEPGRMGLRLGPLVLAYGWSEVKPALESYLKSRPHMRSNGTIWGDLPSDGPHNMVEDRRFMNPEDFAKTFQTWRARCS